MTLKNGVRKMDSKNKTEQDAIKLFMRSIDYFCHKEEYRAVYTPTKRVMTLQKIGSDLSFKLTVGNNLVSYLEVVRTDIGMESGFTKSSVGVVEYKVNGTCDNKRKVCLPNKRQQLELMEVIDQVEKSLRPNSINFIMED